MSIAAVHLVYQVAGIVSQSASGGKEYVEEGMRVRVGDQSANSHGLPNQVEFGQSNGEVRRTQRFVYDLR